MLPPSPISALYPLALAEGEGVGTAYEYYAKRLLLARWLARLLPPRRLLIAGLPEKYGSSLDFFLLAQELAVAEVVVIEDRPGAIEKCRASLAAAQAAGELARLRPHFVPVGEMGAPQELPGKFDLCLASEVLQRLDAAARRRYVSWLAKLAPRVALFVPNGENPRHALVSGLAGLSLSELCALIEAAGLSITCGFLDMPPFPPGLARSAAERERAKHGKLEALAMWALGGYARAERFFPSAWQRSHSHIAYALAGGRATTTPVEEG